MLAACSAHCHVCHSLSLSSHRVLRALLGELIRRTVTQSYPKLLLRRTESVAERMLTNWLTFCLHGYIMVRQGECGGGREGGEEGRKYQSYYYR